LIDKRLKALGASCGQAVALLRAGEGAARTWAAQVKARASNRPAIRRAWVKHMNRAHALGGA
jgi:hypothetical protein